MRLFFGATIPEKTKTQIEKIQEEIRSSFENVRIEGADKLHITLQFIGDFPEDPLDDRKNVETLFSGVDEEIKRRAFKSSAAEAIGMNYFPGKNLARGIWIDCRDDGTLGAIAESVKAVTAQFGVVAEGRAFVPHITVARFHGESRRRSGENYVDLQKLWSNGKLSIERFFPQSVALFESILKSSGSEYRVLSEIGLRGE
jgi:2'-5' RNA ligase